MAWRHSEILCLYLFGKLTNVERVDLVEKHSSLEDACAAIGAMLPEFSDVDRWIDDCESNGVTIVSLWDAPYPSRLRTIDSPPPMLFVWGTLPADEVPSIAIVGTRTCTAQYGKPATDALVDVFVRSQCTIVSGLANGIDMLAHEACCRLGGKTIAVIASGVGRITPTSAQRMAESIVNHGGAIVSEHPFHVAALPPYFPARNRIISGLSDAVVIVESKASGGALITADFAHKQHRHLWAVPGPITSSRSVGTNELIRNGKAQILCSPNDVLNALGLETKLTGRRQELPPELEILGPDAMHIDTIAQRWNCSIQSTIGRLLQHELDGQIASLPGSFYQVLG